MSPSANSWKTAVDEPYTQRYVDDLEGSNLGFFQDTARLSEDIKEVARRDESMRRLELELEKLKKQERKNEQHP